MYRKTDSEPEFDASGQVHPSQCAAASLLALPKLRNIPAQLDMQDTPEEMFDLLARLNRHLPAQPASTPHNTICRMLNHWSTPLLRHVEDKFEFCLGIALGKTAAEMLQEERDAPDSLLYLCVDNYYDDTTPLGPMLETMETENPGLGREILRAFERSPLLIGTPSYVFELASCCYWQEEENEDMILAEYRAGCDSDEEFQSYIDEYVPVKYKDFTDVMPEWAFNVKSRAKEPYRGPKPEPLQRLNKIHRPLSRMFRQLKGQFYPASYPLPCFPITWNDAHHDLITQVVDYQYNMDCQTGYEIWFSPVFLSIDDQAQTNDAVKYAEQAMHYFDACMELLDFLKK